MKAKRQEDVSGGRKEERFKGIKPFFAYELQSVFLLKAFALEHGKPSTTEKVLIFVLVRVSMYIFMCLCLRVCLFSTCLCPLFPCHCFRVSICLLLCS